MIKTRNHLDDKKIIYQTTNPVPCPLSPVPLLILLCFINIVPLSAQTNRVDDSVSRFMARYVVTLLNRGNSNFPSDEANVVLQAKNGYMWFGGYNGLYRYDGSKFTIWDAVSPNGFGSSNIRALYEDKEGTLWIGTNDKGLVAYKNGIFKTYDRAAGLPSNTIRSIAEDSNGNIYCGTLEGIFYIDKEEKITLIHLDTSVSQAVISICIDFNDNLFAVLNSGELFVYTPSGRTYRHHHLLPFSTVGSISVGRVAAGTRRGDAFILYFDSVNERFMRSEQITTTLRIIESVYEDSNHNIWLAAENGIGYLDTHENFHLVGDPSGVGFYRGICEDYQNGYWIAATRGGVTKLTISAFTDFNALYQIDTGGANAFVVDRGYTYIGTNSGIFVLDQNGNHAHENLTNMISSINARVRGISRDSRGNIWICTYSDYGVIRYTPSTGSIRYWTPQGGMDTDRTRYAYELPNGVVAIATAVGVNFIKDDRIISVNEAIETDIVIDLPDIMVLSIVTSIDGTIYLGTDGNGIYAINKQGTVRYREEDGLTGGVVMRMSANKKENGVWVSASPGLCYIDGSNKTVRVINKVPPFTFLDIMQYYDELVLMTSEMIIITNADALLDPDLPYVFTSVGQSDGLNDLINANSWNLITDNGDIYFCTTTGCKFLLRERSAGTIIPYAGIAGITIDGIEQTDFEKGILMPRDADRITFELSYLSFGLIDNAHLRYKLSGHNIEPTTLSKTDYMDVSYTNLRGGSYTMQVWTEDPEGKTGNFIEVSINKEKKFLEYAIVWIVITLLTISITALLVWAIAQNRMRKQAKLQELKLEAVTNRLEKEKAEASERAKSEFIAMVTHELRTPMNAINGMADILLSRDLSGENLKYAQDIKKAGSGLLVLVNDLLDLSKIEAGKLEIIPDYYKLSSLISDTANIIKMRLIDKPVQLLINIDDSIPNNLIGDEVRLRQILLNLLSNAVKFTDAGHIKLAVGIDMLFETEVRLKIIVEDTGKGIKKEDLEKLFGEYVQVDVKTNRHIQGTGLGLSITKKLCAAMGGSVSVESEYGKGSVFTVIIPQLIDLRDKSAAETVNKTEDRRTFPNARILVVDDLPTNLIVAEGLLEPYQAAVETCLSGAEAIELVKNKKFDLILMDQNMPEMDGIEAARLIREWEKTIKNEPVPIIALTANAGAEHEELLIGSGFDDFLAKPIDLEKLYQMLVKWLPEKKIKM